MKTIVLFLHGSGGTGMQLRTFLETAPISSLGQRTFREILDAGLIFRYFPSFNKFLFIQLKYF